MRVILVIFAALSAVLLLGSCSNGPDSIVKIGVNLPLSGDQASYAVSVLNGLKLRVEEINSSGGIEGRRIQLLIEDNKSDAEFAGDVYNKLSKTDKAAAVIGPLTTDAAMIVAKEASSLKVPFISPSASGDRVTAGNPYAFRVCFNDSFQGLAIAAYALREKHFKNAAIMKDPHDEYSSGLSDAFVKAFRKGGGSICTIENYRRNDTEFGIQLKKIKDKNADIVFLPGYPDDARKIMNRATQLKLKSVFCGPDSWDNPIITENTELPAGMFFFFSPSNPEAVNQTMKNFVRNYMAKYDGHRPDAFSVLGYDSMSLLAEALKKGFRSSEIAQALAVLRNIELLSGKAEITQEGNLLKAAAIVEMSIAKGQAPHKHVKSITP